MRLMNFWKKLRKIDVLKYDPPSRSITNRCKHIIYGDDVIAGKKNSQPIIALESTIITHGMPFPENFNTALKVEDAVRKQVCVNSNTFAL